MINTGSTVTLTPSVAVAMEVQDLVTRYGADAVQKALDYVRGFPISEYAFTDGVYTWYLTKEQYIMVKFEAQRGNKISAIKLFREYTSCGLKEAKDAIEGKTWV